MTVVFFEGRYYNHFVMKKIMAFLFLSLVVTGFVYAQIPETEPLSIKQVMDGDTFRLANGQKLKLAGINAPELHDTPKLPQEAARFKKEVWEFRNLGAAAEQLGQRLIRQAGNTVFIEPSTQTFDEQGNLLGYIHVPIPKLEPGMVVDGKIVMQESAGNYHVFLNAYLLQLGLAELDRRTLDPGYKTLFETILSGAKTSKKGLWS